MYYHSKCIVSQYIYIVNRWLSTITIHSVYSQQIYTRRRNSFFVMSPSSVFVLIAVKMVLEMAYTPLGLGTAVDHRRTYLQVVLILHQQDRLHITCHQF